MLRRLAAVGAICGGLTLWTLAYQTIQLQTQFALPDLGYYASNFTLPVDSLWDAIGYDTPNASGEEMDPVFPEGMNYSSFLALHPEHAQRAVLVHSPIQSYFPDFCADW